MEMRTLSVPKSTPATMLTALLPSSSPDYSGVSRWTRAAGVVAATVLNVVGEVVADGVEAIADFGAEAAHADDGAEAH